MGLMQARDVKRPSYVAPLGGGGWVGYLTLGSFACFVREPSCEQHSPSELNFIPFGSCSVLFTRERHQARMAFIVGLRCVGLRCVVLGTRTALSLDRLVAVGWSVGAIEFHFSTSFPSFSFSRLFVSLFLLSLFLLCRIAFWTRRQFLA
jgi:hypothetical protein